jgi:hypothetical protein
MPPSLLNDPLNYRPVSSRRGFLDIEEKEDIRKKIADCIKITLQAGADFSLEYTEPGGERDSLFAWAIDSLSFVKNSLSSKVDQR